jgi:DNA-binding response OmpR family regulator
MSDNMHDDEAERLERELAALGITSPADALAQVEEPAHGTVLIADDDEAIRKLLRSLLERKGYAVIEATNGTEAVLEVRRSLPDLAVLDWEMPFATGREVAAALKSDPLTRRIPIVMLTGRSRVDDKIDALNVGVQDFITKPFDLREFDARVDQQLRWRRLLDDPANAPKIAVPAPQHDGREPAVVLRDTMEEAERAEDDREYERAALAYRRASEAALAMKSLDVANKLQRLAGKMYLSLAENAEDTETIRRGYAQSAKLFLTAGNLRLSNEAAGRLDTIN